MAKEPLKVGTMSSEFPREISFDEIEIGDTIEVTDKISDAVRTVQGVVHMKTFAEIRTKDGVFLGKPSEVFTFLLLERKQHTIDKLGVGSIIAITWTDTGGDSALVLFKNPEGWVEVSPHQAANRTYAIGHTRVGWIKEEWDSHHTTALIILEK